MSPFSAPARCRMIAEAIRKARTPAEVRGLLHEAEDVRAELARRDPIGFAQAIAVMNDAVDDLLEICRPAAD